MKVNEEVREYDKTVVRKKGLCGQYNEFREMLGKQNDNRARTIVGNERYKKKGKKKSQSGRVKKERKNDL